MWPRPSVALRSGSFSTGDNAGTGRLLSWSRRRDQAAALYSFRDVIALRTFVYLREDLPLQRIRKAVSQLREFGSIEHLSKYRLHATNRSVVRAESEDRLVDLVKNPGQFQLKVTMRDVLAPFTNLRGEPIVDLLRPRERLQVDPETRGGYPVVLHTRIPYNLVGELVADGVPPGESPTSTRR
jgi:uncharacterized protein (DUF433 family)